MMLVYRGITVPQARNLLFQTAKPSKGCKKFIDDPPIHDHIYYVWGGGGQKTCWPFLQRFWVGPWPDSSLDSPVNIIHRHEILRYWSTLAVHRGSTFYLLLPSKVIFIAIPTITSALTAHNNKVTTKQSNFVERHYLISSLQTF